MEIFRTIPGYEGLYNVSNYGRVLCVKRMSNGRLKNKFLALSQDGYTTVRLYKNGKSKTIKVHQLVAMVFLGHKPNGYKQVVDHIDFDRTNNRADNLRIISQRKNTDKKHLKSTSEFVGVSYSRSARKYKAAITINGKIKYLGMFKSQLEAARAYNEAKKRL